MTVKVFDLKKSDKSNYYVAEHKNAKEVTEVGFNCEILTEDNKTIGYRTDLYGLIISE